MEIPISPSIVRLVDDDASFLTASSRLLRASGFTVETFDSPTDLLSRLTADSRGCVIADVRMPHVSGLDLQDALVRSGVTLPIIFLTGQRDIPSSVRAMRLGAEDFLEKRAPKGQLLDAVNRALARDARQHAEQARTRLLQSALDSLSPREREVLSHVVAGRLNKQIASDLGIHERTVKVHRTAITTKLGIRSVAELTRFAQAAGMLE